MNRPSTTIIAEAGVNHNGRLAIAKKLVDAAKNAGADIVKFQTFLAENIVVKSTEKFGYQQVFAKKIRPNLLDWTEETDGNKTCAECAV